MDIKNKPSNFLVRNVLSDNFIKEINRIPVLTAQEERELFIKYEESQKRVSDAAGSPNYAAIAKQEEAIQNEIRNEIISRNQRFNFALAKRYDNNEIVMDLVSVGAIGMYEAFQKYDYKKDNRFCTFANWYIRRAINAYLTKENIMVRTTNDAKMLNKVKTVENIFFAREGRMPTDNEILIELKKKYNMSNIDTNDMHKVITTSIDARMDDGDDVYTSSDITSYEVKTASYNDYEEESNNDQLANTLKTILSKLPEREKLIICMSAGYGYHKEYKDQEIAEVLGITSERVRQLKRDAKAKLAKMYNVASRN